MLSPAALGRTTTTTADHAARAAHDGPRRASSTSVGDIVQFNMVDDFVSALDLPIIPKTKLLRALQPQTDLTPGFLLATVVA